MSTTPPLEREGRGNVQKKTAIILKKSEHEHWKTISVLGRWDFWGIMNLRLAVAASQTAAKQLLGPNRVTMQ